MTSIREEIAKRLWQNYIRDEYGIGEMKDEYEYEYGVHNWNTYTDQDKKWYLDDANSIIKMFEKLISSTEEELKKHICDDEDGLIDFGISYLADTLREELEK